MKKVFIMKTDATPEEYLRRMLDCIDENGELRIARTIDSFRFYTAETKKDATHIERVKLNRSLVGPDSLLGFYNDIIKKLDAQEDSQVLEDKNIGIYAKRVAIFAKRIKSLIGYKAPEFIVQFEKCMLMDSIVLYKTDAVGRKYKRRPKRQR